MDYLNNAIAAVLTFLIFITIPAPVWVAIPCIAMIVGLVSAVLRTVRP